MVTTKVKGPSLLKRPPPIPKKNIFNFTMPPGAWSFIFKLYEKKLSCTDFHFEILMVDFFQMEGAFFPTPSHFYHWNGLFTHREGGVLPNKKNNSLSFWALSEKTSPAPPPPPTTSTFPPHYISWGCFFVQKTAPVVLLWGGGAVAFLTPPSPTP